MLEREWQQTYAFQVALEGQLPEIEIAVQELVEEANLHADYGDPCLGFDEMEEKQGRITFTLYCCDHPSLTTAWLAAEQVSEALGGRVLSAHRQQWVDCPLPA